LKQGKILVVGIGEVGSALADVIERTQPVLRHDLEPQDFDEPIEVMHLCVPYQSQGQFEATALSYIARFEPGLTIINSTVVPGTTRAVARKSGRPVAYSPVRGKHVMMRDDLLRYVKFVASPVAEDADCAERHFRSAGMRSRRVNKVETLELAKLAETSYFGVLIAFAQELNRYAKGTGGDYKEATEFFDEIDFLPQTRYFPGVIGGHCVIPNIHLLKKIGPSPLFDAVLDSNRLRAMEMAAENDTDDRAARTRDANERKMLANR
jgi:UDP-N-acetyl-D-mannosaminuronate dehydrogenase